MRRARDMLSSLMVSLHVVKGKKMASWWIALGYPPFDDGKGGFPRTGQVVKYYREQTRDETEKRWTQRKLALCLNVTEQTVRDMENRDASLECERRRRLCECFALPPIL